MKLRYSDLAAFGADLRAVVAACDQLLAVFPDDLTIAIDRPDSAVRVTTEILDGNYLLTAIDSECASFVAALDAVLYSADCLGTA